MKITLIKPNLGRMGDGPYVDEGRMEPLQIGILAALCPPGVEVRFFDDRCEPITFDEPTDLVAITVETFTARRSYEIADEFRSRGIKVVLGGIHVTLVPEEAAMHADSIVLSDAEPVWRDLLQDAALDRLKPRYVGSYSMPQSGVFPRKDIFEGKGYLSVALTQFSRGCIHACNYCAVTAYFQQNHRVRSVNEIVRELEHQRGRLVFFVDDNIVADREAAKALFRALIPLRINWVSQGSIDMVYDRELMDLMCESGCRGNVIGFESVNRAALASMAKTSNFETSDGYEKEIAILNSYGLQTWAAFIVGSDEDTPEGLYDMLRFAMKHKFTFAAFNILMPYPGTPWYAKLKREGRLLYDGKWWLHPDYRFNHAAFKPAKMTAEELTSISFDLRRLWNSPGVIIKRFFAPDTNMRTLSNMVIYWMYNPLFRRETFKKQNMRLGQPGLR